MNRQSPYLITLFFVGMALMAACSKKSFNASEGSVDQQCVDVRPEVKCQVQCTDGSCLRQFDYTINAESQVTDALFVVDNSGSMSEEQAEMASKFPSFLNMLSNVDYRLGVITTDVSVTGGGPSANNGFGALQDGKLIPFQSGVKFLDRSTPANTAQSLFQNTVRRNETLVCERNNYNRNFCPSGDERGLLAAAMAIERNEGSFIRPTGHLAIVILSDEDEGSDGYNNLIDAREQPQNFLNFFRNRFPHKSLNVHSIIIQPNSTAGRNCFVQQSSTPGPDGQYGTVYADLTRIAGGVFGNICAPTYTSQLQIIGQAVSQTREVLPCSPLNGDVEVSFNPEPSYDVEVVKNLAQNEIMFSRALPIGTKIRFQFSCAR